MLADLRAASDGWPEDVAVSDAILTFAAVCPHTYGDYSRSHARSITTLESDVFAEFLHSYDATLCSVSRSPLVRALRGRRFALDRGEAEGAAAADRSAR